MKRRKFIQAGSIAGLGMLMGGSMTATPSAHDLVRITILHTNDMHSRIEPFPDDGSRNANMGGMARRAAMINRIRKAEDHVILLDSGDIFQGTPYFNYFGGELEFKLMSKMGYDAVTLGNHDFDAGIEGLKKQLPHATFSVVNANYDFANTQLKDDVSPYKILHRGGMKIGVFGIGIKLDGLVPKKLYGDIVYQNPVTKANTTAALLKNDLKCDLTICLSHLGYRYKDSTVSDVVVAENSKDIDIILGGHTHTFMYEPDIRKNLDGKEVVINQAGWAGIMLGRLDVWIERSKGSRCQSCKNTFVV